MAEKHDLRVTVEDRASETLEKLQAAIDERFPKVARTWNGPRNLPKPHAVKRRRLIVRASRKANRPRKFTRRQRRRRQAPKPRRGR